MVRRLMIAAAATIALGAVLTAPASALDDGRITYYLALGDSLAAGSQPTGVRGEGYPDQLAAALQARDRKLRLENLGCPGETTVTLIGGGICTYPDAATQLAQAEHFLRAKKGKVRLVTIDIGANDVNRCVRGGVIDEACVQQAFAAVGANVGQIVARLRVVAPTVRTVAMNYYNPYLAAWLSGPAGQELARRSLELALALNDLLERGYAAGRFAIADVETAFSTTDLTTQVPLPGAGLVPLAVARICQWTWMCAPAPLGPDIHANRAGYGVIAQTFLGTLN